MPAYICHLLKKLDFGKFLLVKVFYYRMGVEDYEQKLLN